ncbi:MAG: HDOD domain-containing protein [Verrucomicrobiota bacterium]
MGWFKLGGKKNTESEAPTEAPATAVSGASGADPFVGLEERELPESLADLFLVMEEHLNEIELEDIRSVVETLQQPPPLVEKLTSGLDDPDQLKEAILSSPTLSADVLRVVNSAAFALSSPISSIEHAVTYLGTTMVKGLILQSAVTQVLQFETDVQKAAYMRIWRSSYVASSAAQVYAQLLRFEHPSVHATRALLVNIGDLALVAARPDMAAVYAPKTNLLDRVTGQQQEVMANSAVLSSLLVRQWGLPDDLYDSLRQALRPLAVAPTDNDRGEKELREDVSLYLACRLGDAAAYEGLKDVTDFTWLHREEPDYHYLPAYAKKAGLEALVEPFEERKNARRVQQIINSFGG